MPIHDHDCPKCTFLATVLDHDLYVCGPSPEESSVIARYSSVDSDYASSRVDSLYLYLRNTDRHLPTQRISLLCLAAALAAQRGLT